jgi:ubiquinone/menaquinone biosynthesis C-methylase UbiE
LTVVTTLTTTRTIFWEIHSGLPREGPGDDESTRKAFLMADELPPRPRILDVGAGPGMQTMELARISDGTIVAVDTHGPFLHELRRRAREVGVSHRVTAVSASMAALPFRNESFDPLWSEGAIYIMGFREGLIAWKRLLVRNGYIVVTEPCWIKSEIPGEVSSYWAEYPGMTAIENTQKIIGECGYREIGHFVLPDAAWWNDYYEPLERKLKALREKYRADADALRQLDEAQSEIDTHRKHSSLYGYFFFVMQKAS